MAGASGRGSAAWPGPSPAPATRAHAPCLPPCQGCDRGSDGDHSRTYNTYRLSPDTHYAVDEPPVDAPPRRRSRLSPAQWPEVAARAERESLRALARAYGVSPAAIRRALVAAGRADLLRDPARRRRLAAAAPPPPPAPRTVPRERYGEVARLRQRHTQAEVAAMLGVSQATV